MTWLLLLCLHSSRRLYLTQRPLQQQANIALLDLVLIKSLCRLINLVKCVMQKTIIGVRVPKPFIAVVYLSDVDIVVNCYLGLFFCDEVLCLFCFCYKFWTC